MSLLSVARIMSNESRHAIGILLVNQLGHGKLAEVRVAQELGAIIERPAESFAW